MNKHIKALVMDVDGTLTDGGIYMSKDGEIMKKFHVKDGYAIKHMLPNHNIVPIVLTGRKSMIVTKRCEELGITEVVQGSYNKVKELTDIANRLQIDLEHIAYIGDDVNDFEAMQLVGVRGCPCNAVRDVKNICEFVATVNGGDGAVREFIEWLLN